MTARSDIVAFDSALLKSMIEFNEETVSSISRFTSLTERTIQRAFVSSKINIYALDEICCSINMHMILFLQQEYIS